MVTSLLITSKGITIHTFTMAIAQFYLQGNEGGRKKGGKVTAYISSKQFI